MTSAQDVEANHTHQDDRTWQSSDTPGFKPLLYNIVVVPSLLRLWKEVTKSLKEDDVESATAFKHKVIYHPSSEGEKYI